MTVYVISGGKLVEKCAKPTASSSSRSNFPSPMVSRFEAFASPVTDQTVSSWRQRERDMNAADAVDPRDIPAKAFEKRRAAVQRMKEADNG
jgi:hypothetical protein